MTKKQLFIEVAFKPGDSVKWGPHNANVQSLTVSSIGVMYSISYFLEDDQIMATAFDWELELVQELETV